MLDRLRRVLLALTLLLWPLSVHATTYWTATYGNDGNSCGTAQNSATPRRTINEGAKCAGPGDTLIVRSGVYDETFDDDDRHIIPSGTPGNPVTIQSETQHGAIIRPTTASAGGGYWYIFRIRSTTCCSQLPLAHDIVVDGFTVDSSTIFAQTGQIGIHLTLEAHSTDQSLLGVHDIVFKNNDFTGPGGGTQTSYNAYNLTMSGNKIHGSGPGGFYYGIYFHSFNSIIEYNEIYDYGGYGIHFFADGVGSNYLRDGNTFRGNHIHDNERDGFLYASGASNNQAYNNLIHHNGGAGIQLGGFGHFAQNNTIYQNTIAFNGGDCIRLGGTYAASDTTTRNNICYGNATDAVVQVNGSGNVADHNLCGSSGNGCSVVGNPQFVNAGGSNYHLQSSSPAIGAGTGTGIATDYDGAAYGSPPTIGAFTVGGGGPPPAPTALSFSQEASTAGVGYPMRPAVTVRVLDQAGQLFPSASDPVTVTLTTNPTGATLGGTRTVTPVGGIATFATLTVSLPADGYVLTATASGLTSDTSGPFTVVTGSPAVFDVARPSGSPAGSDSRTCTAAQTPSTPLATFAKGLTCLVIPGSTLRARAGVYPEAIDTETQLIMSGTSWGTPTTIRAYPGETVTLQPAGYGPGTPIVWVHNADAYLIFDGLRLDGINMTYGNALSIYPGVHHVRFQHGDMQHTYYEPTFLQGNSISILDTTIHDVIVWDSTKKLPAVTIQADATTTNFDDITLDHVTISNIWGSGILMDTPSGAITNVHITNSILHHTGQDGVSPAIDLGHGTYDLTTNLLYTNAAGIRLRTGTSATQIVYTTLSGVTGTGIQIDAGAATTVVKDVIVASAGTQITNAGTGTTFTTNLCSVAGTGCTVTGAPLFTNAGANDYTLQSGSPARNAGTAVVGVTVDLGGLPRISGVASDIGAHEYQESLVAVPIATLMVFQ